MTMSNLSDPTSWIKKMIEQAVAASPANDLGYPEPEPAFNRPLVGFSSGSDPLYAEYVAHIGDFYLTPLQIFQKAFPAHPLPQPEDLTVISWILPITSATRTEQGASQKQPSARWARTRKLGEQFNDWLRHEVVQGLAAAGLQAVAPVLAPFWGRSETGAYAPCSNWSERHAAYAAGLGTFGLCDGLITPLGKSMRTGSVVVHLKVPPTPRPYSGRHDYCLFYSHGTCGKCIARCPVNALSEAGHDKKRCRQYTEFKMRDFMIKEYDIDISACGLCQTAVPCMDHIPHPHEG